MHLIDYIPLWLLVIITGVLVIIACECGFRLGSRVCARGKPLDGNSIGSMVQATLGLLAFLLAFTFGVAAERFNDRRVLIIEEANAIRSTYLRADFMPRSHKEEVQNIIRQYVELRLNLVRNPAIGRDPRLLAQGLAESDGLQDRLWAQAVAVGKADLDSDVAALFIESLNEMISLQSERVAAALYARLPDTVWVTLYVMIIIGMVGTGYQCGSAGSRSWLMTGGLAVSLAIVIVMIADLDSPMEGFLRASQQPMIDLGKRIGTPLARAALGNHLSAEGNCGAAGKRTMVTP